MFLHDFLLMMYFEPNQEEAAVLGTSLAMTVNAGTVPLNEAIHMIPDANFDTTFINLLSALATRMGEMDFTAEIQAQGKFSRTHRRDKKRITFWCIMMISRRFDPNCALLTYGLSSGAMQNNKGVIRSITELHIKFFYV